MLAEEEDKQDMFVRKKMEELDRPSLEDSLNSPKLPVIIILDEVRSMHNVGAAFRTADAFGIESIYLCGFTPAPPHRDIRKTALGAEESVRWLHFQNIEEAIHSAKEKGYSIVAVEQAHGSTALNNVHSNSGTPVAYIFGNEVDGVSNSALALCDDCIEIPQQGAKHSLNVSVSIGVVLWEAIRALPSE